MPPPQSSGGSDSVAEEYAPHPSMRSAVPMSTHDTIVAARERQVRKDEYARASRFDESHAGGATLYEPGMAAGNFSNDAASPSASAAASRRRVIRKPSKPDFQLGTNKAPMSRKLIQAQQEAEVYTTHAKQTEQKKLAARKRAMGPPKPRENPRAAAAAAEDESAFSDEEAALARMESAPSLAAQQAAYLNKPITSTTNARHASDLQRAVPRKETGAELERAAGAPPVEHNDDTPWLDSVVASMGATTTQGKAAHRASIIFAKHEPLVGASPDVDQLNQSMQALFQIQRQGSLAKPVSPSAKGPKIIFGQRIIEPHRRKQPVNTSEHGIQPRKHEYVEAASDKSPKTAAQRAQDALAAALASIRPPAPLPVVAATGSVDPPSAAVAARLDPGAVGVEEKEVDDSEIAQFDSAYTALSPDAFYQSQLGDTIVPQTYARRNLFDHPDLEDEAEDEDEEDEESESDSDGERGQISEQLLRQHGYSNQQQYQQHGQGQPQPRQLSSQPPPQSGGPGAVGGKGSISLQLQSQFEDIPRGTTHMYLQKLAEAQAKKANKWRAGTDIGAVFGGTVLDLGEANATNAAGPRNPREKIKGRRPPPPLTKGQYKRTVEPGKFSVERKRARKQAAYLAQLHQQHSRTQRLGAPDEHLLQGQGDAPLSLLHLAYSPGMGGVVGGAEDLSHPALKHHIELLDGYPEAAQFLAGGDIGSSPADYGQFDEQEYLGQEQEEYGEQYEGSEQGYGAPSAAQSHADRMARSRAAAQQPGRNAQFPEQSHGSLQQNQRSRNNLRTELMSALHAGLFGDEPEPSQPHSSRPGSLDASAAVAMGGRLPFTSPHRLTEQGPAADRFHFRNPSTGAREFVAEQSGAHGDDEEYDDGAASQSTLTHDGFHAQQAFDFQEDRPESVYSTPAFGVFDAPSERGGFDSASRAGEEGSVVPPDLMDDVISAHFLGRELQPNQSGRYLPKSQQTSLSATKRRTDQLMQRLFNPEQARQASIERLAVHEAAERGIQKTQTDPAAQKRPKRPATARPSSRGAQQQQQPTNVASQQQPSRRQQQEQAQDATGSEDAAGLSTLSEESHSEAGASSRPRAAPAAVDEAGQGAGAEAGGDRSLAVTSVAGNADQPLSPTSAAVARKKSGNVLSLRDRQILAAEAEKVRTAVAAAAAVDLAAPKHKPTVSPTRRSKRAGASGSGSQELGPDGRPLPRAAPSASELTHLDLLYYKAKLADQKKIQMRAALAAQEIAGCTFAPNMDQVMLKGKLMSKTAAKQAGKKKSKKKKASGADASEDEEDAESSIHSSMASSSGPASSAAGGAGSGAPLSSGAAATKARLEALYLSHQATQERIRATREAAEQKAREDEAKLTFHPNVHPHRPVATTVALANQKFIRGFDEKVSAMRKGAQTARDNSFRDSLRGDTSGANTMNFSLERTPISVAPQHYIMASAGKQVVLQAHVPPTAATPGSTSAIPFSGPVRPASVAPSDATQAAGGAAAGPAAAEPRSESHTPVPQIIMRGAPGSDVPFQMLSGTNPGSPGTLAIPPSANRATFFQDGEALNDSLRRIDGRAKAFGAADPLIGIGSIEGTDKLVAPVVSSAAASMIAAGTAGMGLGFVLPSNSPGSILPRALAVHDHVSSYSYQYAKAQLVAQGDPSVMVGAGVPLKPPTPQAGMSGHVSPQKSRHTSSMMGGNVNVQAGPPSPKVQPSQTTVQAAQQTSTVAPAAPVASHAAAAAPGPTQPTPVASPSPPPPSVPAPTPAPAAVNAAAAAAAAAPEPVSVPAPAEPQALKPFSDSDSEGAAGEGDADADASAADATVLLFVDIQLGAGTERIVVHRGDSTAQLAAAFTAQHALDPAYAPVIQGMLDQQIAALPSKA